MRDAILAVCWAVAICGGLGVWVWRWERSADAFRLAVELEKAQRGARR